MAVRTAIKKAVKKAVAKKPVTAAAAATRAKQQALVAATKLKIAKPAAVARIPVVKPKLQPGKPVGIAQRAVSAIGGLVGASPAQAAAELVARGVPPAQAAALTGRRRRSRGMFLRRGRLFMGFSQKEVKNAMRRQYGGRRRK